MPELVRSTLASTAFIATIMVGGIGSAGAAQVHVTVENRSDSTLVEFYSARSNDQSWSNDRLGGQQLGPNFHIRVDISDASSSCTFDFKAVFDDGSSIVRRKVDVCSIPRLTYR